MKRYILPILLVTVILCSVVLSSCAGLSQTEKTRNSFITLYQNRIEKFGYTDISVSAVENSVIVIEMPENSGYEAQVLKNTYFGLRYINADSISVEILKPSDIVSFDVGNKTVDGEKQYFVSLELTELGVKKVTSAINTQKQESAVIYTVLDDEMLSEIVTSIDGETNACILSGFATEQDAKNFSELLAIVGHEGEMSVEVKDGKEIYTIDFASAEQETTEAE